MWQADIVLEKFADNYLDIVISQIIICLACAFSYQYPISNTGHISSQPSYGDLNKQFIVFWPRSITWADIKFLSKTMDVSRTIILILIVITTVIAFVSLAIFCMVHVHKKTSDSNTITPTKGIWYTNVNQYIRNYFPVSSNFSQLHFILHHFSWSYFSLE